LTFTKSPAATPGFFVGGNALPALRQNAQRSVWNRAGVPVFIRSMARR
jgi:hypothetical protein